MRLLDLDIFTWKYLEFLRIIRNPEKPTLVFTPNPEMLVQASHDPTFLGTLRKADYLTPDGTGLYTASLIQNGNSFLWALFQTFLQRKSLQKRYGELIKWSDLARDLVSHAMESHERVLMIDNYRIEIPQNPFEFEKKKIQSNLPNLFRERFPSLDIEMIFDGEMSPEEIAKLILDKNIRYVFSCIGMRVQEERLVEIWSHIPSTHRVAWLGVGSSIDYLLWLQKRAPLWIQKLGFEWLYRLVLSPQKRWRRIYTALIEFPQIMKIKSRL